MKKKNQFLVYLVLVILLVVFVEIVSDWEHFIQGLIGIYSNN